MEILMQLFAALFLACISLAAQAAPAQKKLKLTPPGQKAQATEDPGSATRLLFEDTRNMNSVVAGADKKTGGAKITSTCTDNMGMIYRNGDPGYEGCQRTFSMEQPKSQGDKNRPASMGITIGQ